MTARAAILRSARSVAVVAFAFLVAGATYQITGYSMSTVFSGVWQGAVTAPGALTSTLRWTLPLLLVALGVTVAFRAGFFNIGGQGQMYVGAITALVVAGWVDRWPTAIALIFVVIAGCAAGAIWSLGPGLLRAHLQADEVITTLMMNFIAALLLQWVASGPLKDASGSGQADQTRSVADHLRLSGESGVSVEMVGIAIAVTIGVGLLLTRTRFGLRARLAGRNPTMARWQGVDARNLSMQSFALSGLLAGLAGALELLGPAGQLTYGFSPDLGFVAVVIALVGGLRVAGVVLAAVFFGGLHAAVLYLPIVTDLPTSALDLLNGVVALFITVSVVPVAWLRRRRVRPPVTQARSAARPEVPAQP